MGMHWAETAADMPGPVQVTMGDIGAGFIDHNLTCWFCNERPAQYWANPVWVFAPCEECQELISLSFEATVKTVEREQRNRHYGRIWDNIVCMVRRRERRRKARR